MENTQVTEKVRMHTYRCAECLGTFEVHPDAHTEWEDYVEKNMGGVALCEATEGCSGALHLVREGETTTEYMNLYAVRDSYGGPEEGGWWYQSGTALGSIPLPATWEWTGNIYGEQLCLRPRVKPVHLEAARNLLNLTAYHDTKNYRIDIEPRMASDYPVGRPRYE